LAPAAPVSSEARGDGLHVLVIDDDPIVAAALQATVAATGATVIMGCTFGQGLGLLRTEKDLHAVFIDYRLDDGRTADELIQIAQQRGVIVILTSAAEDLRERPGLLILAKPYSHVQVRRVVTALKRVLA
jgi:DNA-binding NtrC family response regulator